MTHRGKRSVGCTLYALCAVVSGMGACMNEPVGARLVFSAFTGVCILAVAVFSYDEKIQKPKEVDTP